MAHVSRWLHARDLDVADLPRWTQQFLQARQNTGYEHHLTDRALRPLLAYLRDQGATPLAPTPLPTGPVEEALARYRRYLTVERGLGEATARGYVDAVRPFLHRCVSADGVIQGLGEADVTAFMVARCAEQSCTARATDGNRPALAAELPPCQTGAVTRSLVTAVPSVASRRLAKLPPRLDPDHVQRLLAACDRRTLAGCRDFAVITTLARLGLRVAELANLRLDDLRSARRRGRHPRQGTPSRAHAPPARRGRRDCRVPPPAAGERPGAHRLRSSACSSGTAEHHRHDADCGRRRAAGRPRPHPRASVAPLRSNTPAQARAPPLSEIQQFLRHARLQTTAIYAKVDYDTLRTIARPWPGGAA